MGTLMVGRTINGILARSGQVCVAASLVYVQETIADRFVELYVEKMRAAAQMLGDQLDPNVAMGPLVDAVSLNRVKSMVARAKEEAELVVGGNQSGDKGCFMEPTVFRNPRPDAQILKDEVFGPVSVILTFKTEQEVVHLANDTEFGLNAGLFTRDLNRALRVSAKLQAGVVGVNCVSVVSSVFAMQAYAANSLTLLVTS